MEQEKEYTPINFAFLIVEPEDGLDKSLCPIIFLHGLMETKEVWHNIAKSVCNVTKRKAYIYDARNHGDSDWTEKFTMDMLIDDLNYFMDINNISKAILIGYSMGGYAAARFALNRPEKVELVIIEEALLRQYPKYIIGATIKLMLLWADAVSRAPIDTNVKEAIKFAVDWMYDQIPQNKQEYMSAKENLYEYNYAWKLNNGRYEIKLNIPVIKKTINTWENISSQAEGVFDGPACFIYGRSSIFNVKSDDEIRPHFPNAELEIMDGATHIVHVDQPEKYLNTIINFLLKNQVSKY